MPRQKERDQRTKGGGAPEHGEPGAWHEKALAGCRDTMGWASPSRGHGSVTSKPRAAPGLVLWVVITAQKETSLQALSRTQLCVGHMLVAPDKYTEQSCSVSPGSLEPGGRPQPPQQPGERAEDLWEAPEYLLRLKFVSGFSLLLVKKKKKT